MQKDGSQGPLSHNLSWLASYLLEKKLEPNQVGNQKKKGRKIAASIGQLSLPKISHRFPNGGDADRRGREK